VLEHNREIRKIDGGVADRLISLLNDCKKNSTQHSSSYGEKHGPMLHEVTEVLSKIRTDCTYLESQKVRQEKAALQEIQRRCKERVAAVNTIWTHDTRISVNAAEAMVKELEGVHHELNTAMLEEVKWDACLAVAIATFKDFELELERYKKLVENALQLGNYVSAVIEGGIVGVQDKLTHRIVDNQGKMKGYLDDFVNTYLPFHILVRRSELHWEDKIKTHEHELKMGHTDLAAAGLSESEAGEAQAKIIRATNFLKEDRARLEYYKNIISEKEKKEAAELLTELRGMYPDPEEASRQIFLKNKSLIQAIRHQLFKDNIALQRLLLGNKNADDVGIPMFQSPEQHAMLPTGAPTVSAPFSPTGASALSKTPDRAQ